MLSGYEKGLSCKRRLAGENVPNPRLDLLHSATYMASPVGTSFKHCLTHNPQTKPQSWLIVVDRLGGNIYLDHAIVNQSAIFLPVFVRNTLVLYIGK